MWAIIPILRYFSKGNSLGIEYWIKSYGLRVTHPARWRGGRACYELRDLRKMGESAVGLGHLMGVLSLFNGLAFIIGGGHEFFRQFGRHGLAFLFSSGGNQPAISQNHLAIVADGYGNLIISAADSAASDLQRRSDIFNGFIKNFQGIMLSFFRNYIKGMINHGLRHGSFAVF